MALPPLMPLGGSVHVVGWGAESRRLTYIVAARSKLEPEGRRQAAPTKDSPAAEASALSKSYTASQE